MVFSSALFLFYFLPLFLVGYFVAPKRLRNLYTTCASLGFYAWGAPTFLPIFLASCVTDYLLAKTLSKTEAPTRRQQILWVSMLLNVGLLLYFKYANFFVEQVTALTHQLGFSFGKWHKIALPIGISFFTFHKISYIVDIYRRTSPPVRSLGEYFLYITFFPQLIAGPIVRYHEIQDQIQGRKHTWDGFVEGCWRFILGLGSKVLLADPMAAVATHVFSHKPYDISVGYTWLGTLAYTMQIYFDFAGYSSMAIGLALMVGFRFPENFNHPYLAVSVTDFWRRWHMSLSRWMRDYLYIPLGGNRVSPNRQKLNLWVVFLISGFWHGAEWTFIAWGIFHGFFLALERTSLGHLYLTISPLLRRALTFVTIMFGWVLFRSESLSEAIARWGRMIGLGAESLPLPRASLISDVGIIVLTVTIAWCLIVEPLVEGRGESASERRPLYESHPLLYPVLIVICVLSILFIEAGRYSPFIYFQF